MVEEQTYYQTAGSLLRPFLLMTSTTPRGYSVPLQRKITDFGADVPFGKVGEKLMEHYGINAPISSIRNITLNHAEILLALQDTALGQALAPAQAVIISETDGSMVPMVTSRPLFEGEVVDRRKGKILSYREARLTLAHAQGSATPVFAAIIGNVDQVGHHMSRCVNIVGLDQKTHIHAVGDGAPWIADQIDKHFGAQASYLVDFYHLCEYLSAAAPHCAPGVEIAWRKQQEALLKNSLAADVLLALKPYIEPENIDDNQAPVRLCYRYMTNRLQQLDYKSAIEKGLPIGSGEIESAHRYVIQKRLKIAGAWWSEGNIKSMLALRVNRANNDWNDYWNNKAA